jgi:hypothetical protein
MTPHNTNGKTVAREHAITESFLSAGSALPVVVTPKSNETVLSKWMYTNREKVEHDSVKYGGILFRGFGIDTVDKFNSLMKVLSDQTFKYVFRSSPRHSLSERVYESTTYPKDRKIKLHSEQSYSYASINKIIFCCTKKAASGGETPIADNRKILARLSPGLRQKFESKGILYTRNLSPFIGMPWQEVFQTSDKEVVMADCKKNNIDFRFGDNESLELKWTKEAIGTHPLTGEKVWFNHGYFFNKLQLV